MGIRGELFSTRVQLQNRTYFFNVKENRLGDLYLNIVESKNREGASGFERQSVILFADDLKEFLKGFDESLQVLERQSRDKRKNKPPSYRADRNYEEGPPGREHFSGYQERDRSKGTYPKRETYTPDRPKETGDPPYSRNPRNSQKSRVVRTVRRREPWEDH